MLYTSGPMGLPFYRDVRRRALLRAGALVLAALPGGALAQARRHLGPREALHARVPMLLVVAPPDQALPDEEAIGDWANYLNAAVLDLPVGVTVSRLTRMGFRDLLAAPAIRRDYATLFVRSDRSALLHEGLVLDPPVYTAGFAYLSGGTAPPRHFGLAATQIRPR